EAATISHEEKCECLLSLPLPGTNCPKKPSAFCRPTAILTPPMRHKISLMMPQPSITNASPKCTASQRTLDASMKKALICNDRANWCSGRRHSDKKPPKPEP